ncbi:MAG TPA: ZIP family metal transporter [Longimicrobiaceae bacterium]|nr:ZIP family metal transporter [Longimicrobiaceae bacterium]
MQATALTVGLLALVTSLATGLGALPLLFARRLSRRWVGLANALAAGLMIAASVGLLYEGAIHGIWTTVLGLVAGVLFVRLSSGLLGDHEGMQWGELKGADARKALLLLGIMTVHSVTEGVGLGVSFGGGEALGVLITVVLALHNIPEGLAISLAMVPRGASVKRAAFWSVFSSLPQPLLAIPAFLAVESFGRLLGAGLGFAAGAMFWMSARELVPEALEDAPRGEVAGVLVVSVVAMLLVQALVQP